MKKWDNYRSDLANESFDAIIIGSGIGGLSTGALLALNGQRVLVLEKHFKIGGWTHTFRRDNYEWDVGIHYIGEVHKPWSAVRRLFDLVSDGQLKWSPMDANYDRIIFPDQTYNFTAPREQFVKDMISYFPKEEQAIRTYMTLLDQSVRSAKPYFSNKAMPDLLGRITYPFMTRKFFQLADQTTYEVLRELTDNQEMIGVLTGQWGDHGLPPKQSSFAMHAFVVRHYLDGGNYPTGTSRSIAETISTLIENHGGQLAVNAAVEEIIIHNGAAVGVRLDNGDELNAATIISSTGVMNTYEKLIGSNQLPANIPASLQSVQKTESYVCLHIGLNGSARDLGLKNTNLWIYPGYDHDQNVQNFIQDPEADFPVVYVSFPSAKDETWDQDHAGYATMEAITMARWNWYTQWQELPWKKRGELYENEKKKLSRRIMDVVHRHVPGIKDAIDYLELSTPLTVRDLANYQQGEMYGVYHTPQRFRQRWLKPRTEIKNLFLTGQDVTTAGVTSALFSGLLTASTVLKKDLTNMLKS
ncbi:MAG: NAD(P)/FAD-dependent oxidoreductase [Candidatus Marinimicrobia bacterium]|nr:NAD(P)/FAD-dependent oxidoreductase [Candidatus Neomarinimicrobiota bacterium]